MKIIVTILLLIIGLIFTVDEFTKKKIKKACFYIVATVAISIATNYIWDMISFNSDEINKLINIDTTNVIYNEITNEEYLYKIKIPGFLDADNTNDAMDKRFNLDGIELVIKARKYLGEIPYDFTREYMLESFDGTVLLDYNQLSSEGWYVISIKTDKRFHYRKCILSEVDNLVRMFTFSVPVTEMEKYYEIIDVIENSFRRYEK